MLTFTDRNGNVHTYTYDILGRQTIDAVTTLGSGVDGAVRRIETEYDTQGNVYKLTSYDASTSDSVVNQIQREFDGLGNLLTEWQAVSGAVNTSTSPKVQYAWSFAPSGSTNHNRLTSITYPNGRVVTYNYASGLNADISRLSSITDGGTTLESYESLGYGTVVKRGHAEPGIELNYVKYSGESNGDAGDQYAGLDRFGRIVDQRWTTSTLTAKDRRQYGYDRNSNRLYMDNIVETTRSELYAYDGFNQLTSMDRGTLNGGKNGLTGAASRAQDWDYDGLGNWDSLTTDGGSAVTRGHNKQNEITSISGASTPPYDANGNLLTDEAAKQFVYDAWNRLAIVKSSGGSTLATYKYDATGRRVRETRSGVTTDLYYSTGWQVLEERVSGTATKNYVWSPVYVDALIARDRDSDSNGSLEERLYAVHDANFNVVALLDTSGAVVERFAYDAFGVFSVLTPGWGARGSSSYGWNYLHQGGRWDADGGLYSFRHREYSPTLGRWIQMDPLSFASNELNVYAFVSNTPYGLHDPFGLSPDVSSANEAAILNPATTAMQIDTIDAYMPNDNIAIPMSADDLFLVLTLIKRRDPDNTGGRSEMRLYLRSAFEDENQINQQAAVIANAYAMQKAVNSFRLNPDKECACEAEKLINNLKSARHAIRVGAQRKLLCMGACAVPTIQAALKTTTDEEVRKRLEDIIPSMSPSTRGSLQDFLSLATYIRGSAGDKFIQRIREHYETRLRSAITNEWRNCQQAPSGSWNVPPRSGR